MPHNKIGDKIMIVVVRLNINTLGQSTDKPGDRRGPFYSSILVVMNVTRCTLITIFSLVIWLVVDL